MDLSPLLSLSLVLALATTLAAAAATRPASVSVGALFTYDSIIGRSAKLAIELAVEDVNANPGILAGTRLALAAQDTNCSGFLGTIEALELMEKDVVAIIGPQSSGIAHSISHVANEMHVPLLSFAATDPTLASLEYQYFLRTVHSDYFQMHAVADIVEYYQWKEVCAVFVDDDYGRGAVEALGDALALKRAKISYKAALPPNADMDAITELLITANNLESRVFVLHVNPDSGMRMFKAASDLRMLADGYVWIATDWLSAVLDSSRSPEPSTMALIQGSIVLRHHTPDSELKRRVLARWNNETDSPGLNSYGLYAYDSVLLVADAIDRFLDSGQKISFSADPRLHDTNGSTLRLASLKIFDGGEELLKQLLLTNITGVAGRIQFDQGRNLVHPAYDILNIRGTGSSLIGYWSKSSGLSVAAPEMLNASASAAQQLYSVIWPGEGSSKPKGWVFPNNGQPLRVGVPNRASFKEFASRSSGTNNVSGYCVDIFNAAVKLLPYPVPCSFIPIGDGLRNPSYDDIINMLALNMLDAAVGDFAIVRNRTKIAEFTQPYTSSGLVIIAPVVNRSSSAWAFMKPFTLEMWCVTGVLFLFVGVVVWILERRSNDQFRGSPRRQLVTVLWFSFSTMFFAHRENTVSTLGRFVLIIWLFVVLIINSSYTASLTSILTVQQLSTGIQGLQDLISSTDRIGYQEGKFTRSYLMDALGIPPSRLMPLNTEREYSDALRRGTSGGGVAAIVDEMPFVEIFLSTNCDFRVVGQEFTKEGWGFAFQRDSPLADDLSTAILQLSESGSLQTIHDAWFSSQGCGSGSSEVGANRLGLGSFWGLFLVCALVCVLALIVFFAKICWQYKQYSSSEEQNRQQQEIETADRVPPRRLGSLNSFKDLISFVDKKEEEIRRVIKRKPSNKDDGQGSSHSLPSSSPH